MNRTHYCGEVNGKQNNGEAVTLCGWIQRRRDHGGLIFIDLRDRTGLVQLVIDPDIAGDYFVLGEKARPEYVIQVTGKVSLRPEGQENPNLATGDIEIYITEMEILNEAKTPPFLIEDNVDCDENVRLKYRYLDLRRPELQKNMKLRHDLTMKIRNYLDKSGFWEIETPMLTQNTPEGARCFLVPSRVHQGEFYALPQSPQLLKQMLMISGMDKYFQIVRCFRDEDLRADRQPEFTQLDIEMSFVNREDIMSLMENMMAEIYRDLMGVEIKTPFLRLTYADAMERFGSDKPDLRFGMELKDISDIAKESNFKVFAANVEKGGVVKGINVKGGEHFSRRELDDLTKYAGIFGAKGMAWMVVIGGEDKVKSPIAKFFTSEQIDAILERLSAEKGDMLMFISDNYETTCNVLGNLRNEIAKRENLIDPNENNFLWVVDFPMFEYDDEEQRYAAKHHPFTSPMDEDLDKLESHPDEVRAKAYDMILNGVELGGGSIRIHRSEVQSKVFGLLGLSKEDAIENFGFLLNALQFGTPPHGGIAFGIDRMVMLMTQRKSIRDVIAFPKTQSAACLTTNAPGAVAPKQLRELGLELRKKDEE
ncbi:MAG: aspartate--tRNA ligase [Clostridiales bacterium]